MGRNGFSAGGFRRVLAGGAVVLAAAAMLLPGVAYADGGGGHGTGGAGTGGDGGITWIADDDMGASTADNVKAQLSRRAGIGYVSDGVDDGPGATRTAVDNAVTECKSRFRTQYPGEGEADCRLFAVGVVNTDRHFTGASGGLTQDQWLAAYVSQVGNGTYTHEGVKYNTQQVFSDGVTTIDSLAERETRGGDVCIVVIVLNQYEPPVDVPPAPPEKTVRDGVSADGMTNTTVISSHTGRMGSQMTFGDRFDPHGQHYTVSNQRVFDATANHDVSGQFAFDTKDGTTPAGDVAHATWKGGSLPDDHVFEWRLDVNVQTPDTSHVDDTGRVDWKGITKTAGQDTPSHLFPTWKPSPDKSWVRLDATGKWQAVVDPDHTNKTGADGMKFLDGDRVASVVNGTVDAHLIDAPTALSLADDWSKADYLVDPAKVGDIKVFEADGRLGANGHYERASVADIASVGRDVTSQFDVTLSGSKAVAKAKASYLNKLKGMSAPLQVTMLVPMTVDFANGKGAGQARRDHNAKPGDELTFCTDDKGGDLTNAGSETVNGQTEPTNEPRICGYVPPVDKDVIGEAGAGGDQGSVDGKVVYPGQKVEYQLDTQPKLPADLAYNATRLIFTDQYDQYLSVDKQTLELMDLNTGRVVPKSRYTTRWDDAKHLVALTVTDPVLIGQWKAAGTPRVQLRFEGTVSKAAPTDHKVGNRWVLTLNNSLTPSNEVFNIPPSLNPVKHDNQGAKQGDPTVSIDGRTMLLGDTGNYVIDLDATQSNQAYKVWRLGIVDDFDEQYLKVDPSSISILGDDGRDYTSRFNVQVSDGVLYAFAKRADTLVPATGETVKGDPQPADLKAYADSDSYDPLTDPAIDQSLLGQRYHLTMPYTVVKVADGYVVRNKATQVENDVRKQTNEVSNPLKPINPSKDVVVRVGGESVNGSSVYKGHVFLYRLDSSILPAHRAYPNVDTWAITDKLDPAYDEYTGQWAVYASRDLYRDGRIIADKGSRIAGSGFDGSRLGGDMFTLRAASDGTLTVAATDAYKALVSTDDSHEQGWRAYVQCRRVKVTSRHENKFVETVNDKANESNVVWTRTPDMTPSLHIEKWDQASGWPNGDRDDPKDAKTLWRDGDTIVFTITNTSNNDGGHGAVYKASDLKLEDRTIAGDGQVTDLKYPDNWGTLVLGPGEHVDVTGTLKGVTGHHTDRAKVVGTPLVECPVPTSDPFDASKKTDQRPVPADGMRRVRVGDRTLCADTSVESNQDDWNAARAPVLARTGSAVLAAVLAAVLLAGAGCGLMYVRRRSAAAPNADSGEEQ